MRNTYAQLDSNILLQNNTENTNSKCLKRSVFVISHVFSFMLGYFISSKIYEDASTGSCL